MKIEKKIGFLCDLSETSGQGHFSRCIALKKELIKLGCNCYFICNDENYEFFKSYVSKDCLLKLSLKSLEESKNLIKPLLRENFDIIIIDSYRHSHKTEAMFRENNILTVSIDDHLHRHDSHLVFSNRACPVKPNVENPRSAMWYNSAEFILAESPRYSKPHLKTKHAPENILLHAGASSAYPSIKPLMTETLIAARDYNFNAHVICTTENSQRFVNKIIKNLQVSKHVKIIPYVKDLKDQLHLYDVVVGPAGTTTFECLMAGVLPFSAPLLNDGRDSPESWPYLGHILHLNHDEAQDHKIIRDLWKYCIKDFSKLTTYMKNQSQKLDGKGARRIAKIIVKHSQLFGTKITHKNVDFKSKDLISKVASCGDARLFLSARNQEFVRENSSVPSHVISWPEHLNWWDDAAVHRYALWINKNIIGFHWHKIVRDIYGQVIISGWMPVPGVEKKFEVAAWLLKHQIEKVKQHHPNQLWLISVRKENLVAHFLNKRAGFLPATELSTARAAKIFDVTPKSFDFMEMSL